MNFERYIAKRIGRNQGRGFPSLITRIAIGAIALSMMVMMITTNVITGFKNEISEKVFDFWGHIQITDGNAGESFEAIPFDRDERLLDAIRSIGPIKYTRPPSIANPELAQEEKSTSAGVESVAPYIVVNAIISDNEIFEGLLLRGIEPDYAAERIQDFLSEGEVFQAISAEPSRDIIISATTAQRMSKNVGDRLIVTFILDENPIKRRFTISGIYNTGLIEYDQRFAVVDLRILQEVLGWDANQISGIEVAVENIQDTEVLNEYIYFELLPGNLYSESIRSKFFQIFEWLELQNINEYVIVILMILVALINMITALLIFVLERTKMVGILKALGANNWSIRKIFLYHAGRILLIGMLLGNLLGIGFSVLQKTTGLLKLSEEYYYLSQVPIELNVLSMTLINIGTLVTVLFCLIIPSKIISGISPVKTIQFN